jgi:tetratricopeptide (TPR) repeat protein
MPKNQKLTVADTTDKQNISAATQCIEIGNLYYTSAKFKDSIPHYRNALSYLPHSCPEKAFALHKLALAYYKIEAFSYTLTIISHLLDIIDNHSVVKEKDKTAHKAEILELQAKCYFKTKQLEKCLESFDKALSLHHFDLQKNKQIFLTQYQALKLLSKEQADKLQYQAYTDLFYGLQKISYQHSIEEKIILLENALQNEKFYQQHKYIILFHIGKYNLELEKHVEALKTFQQIIFLTKQSECNSLNNTDKQQISHHIGVCHGKLGNISIALNFLNTAIKYSNPRDNNSTALFHDLATCLLLNKQYQTATKYYNAVIMDTHYATLPGIAAIYGLAQCYKEQGDNEAAHRFCINAIKQIDTKVKDGYLKFTDEVRLVRHTILNYSKTLIPQSQNPALPEKKAQKIQFTQSIQHNPPVISILSITRPVNKKW